MVYKNRCGYRLCISESSSHKASFTQWFCHKTLANGIAFILNCCSLWSNTCTRNSLYVKLAHNLWCPMNHVWLQQLWNMKYVTPSKLGGNLTLLANGLTRFFTWKYSAYLRLSLPFLLKSCQLHFSLMTTWHTQAYQLQTQACEYVHPLQAARGWPNPPSSQTGVTQATPWPKWGWSATPNIFFLILFLFF
jgi:hypothetical protein